MLILIGLVHVIDAAKGHAEFELSQMEQYSIGKTNLHLVLF